MDMHPINKYVERGRVKVRTLLVLTMNTIHRPSVKQTLDSNKLDMPRRLVDNLARTLKKGVTSCDKPRVGACSLRSEDA